MVFFFLNSRFNCLIQIFKHRKAIDWEKKSDFLYQFGWWRDRALHKFCPLPLFYLFFPLNSNFSPLLPWAQPKRSLLINNNKLHPPLFFPHSWSVMRGHFHVGPAHAPNLSRRAAAKCFKESGLPLGPPHFYFVIRKKNHLICMRTSQRRQTFPRRVLKRRMGLTV